MNVILLQLNEFLWIPLFYFMWIDWHVVFNAICILHWITIWIWFHIQTVQLNVNVWVLFKWLPSFFHVSFKHIPKTVGYSYWKHIEYSPFIYIGIIVLVLQIYMFPLKFDINPIPSAAAICNKYYKLKSDTTNWIYN